MYNTVKESFISFVLIFLLSFILWYSNCFNDRIYAVFFFFCAVIQLIQYAIYSNGDTIQGARLIYCLAVLQVFAVSVALFLAFRSTKYALLLKIYVILTFAYCVFWLAYGWSQDIDCSVGCHISYMLNGKVDVKAYFWVLPIVVSVLILTYISYSLNYPAVTVVTAAVFGLMLVIATWYYQDHKATGSVFDVASIAILVVFILNSLGN